MQGIRAHMSSLAAMLGSASRAWRPVSDAGASAPPSFESRHVDDTSRETNVDRTSQEGAADESVDGSRIASGVGGAASGKGGHPPTLCHPHDTCATGGGATGGARGADVRIEHAGSQRLRV